MLAAIVPYVGIALVASAALPNEPRSLWIEAPMLGVVDDFPQAWLREPLRYIVAASAVAILAAACNAAMSLTSMCASDSRITGSRPAALPNAR